jgi:TPR repeat protein
MQAMLSSMKNALATVRSRFANLTGPLRLTVTVSAFIAAFLFLLWIFDKIFLFLVARSYVDEIAEAFDLNRNLATAIAWLVFAAIIILTRFLFSFSKSRRRTALAGLLVLLVGQSLVLWIGTSGEIITRSGKAIKCYVITRDSVIYRERPGIDPSTGRECKSVTPELVEKLREYERGNRPIRMETANPVFFESGTGRPIVWFYKNKNGEIELFNLMGFHPETGDELEPVSKEIVELWKAQTTDRTARDVRRAPERVDPNTYAPFDPKTGEARIWFHRTDSGDYEFYNRAGYGPQTGEALIIITRDVLDEWHKSQAEKAGKKCYVITRDGVRYSDKPGIDQLTGRQCREITDQLIERLREYEKGKRPTRVASNDPTFFDPATGEPIVWYLKNATGQIEFFDLMGFHPATGEELLPVTKEVADEWSQQRRKCVPAPVKIGPDTRFFDPATGNPQLWYWRSVNGEYEFFDCEGFHPRNGEALKPFNRDILRSYENDIREREKQLRAEQERLRKEQEEREQKEAKQKAERDRNQKEEAERRADELRRASEAARRCDELAANPNDSRRIGQGVAFDALKTQAREAMASCELAVAQNPTELRFRYQLGRALEWIDRKKALQIHQELVARGYPAAFDNLGWLYFTEKRDPAQAVVWFRRGVQAGDSDAMVSLAEMIERRYTIPANPSEEKLQLYGRAAKLGNVVAMRAYQAESAKERATQQERMFQVEQERRMMQIIGTVIQNIPRR